MDKFFTVVAVIAPILATVILGMIARKKAIITQEGVMVCRRLF